MRRINKTGKAVGKHVISLYSSGISHVVQIKDVKKLQPHTENDSIIRDKIAVY